MGVDVVGMRRQEWGEDRLDVGMAARPRRRLGDHEQARPPDLVVGRRRVDGVEAVDRRLQEAPREEQPRLDDPGRRGGLAAAEFPDDPPRLRGVGPAGGGEPRPEKLVHRRGRGRGRRRRLER